MDVALFKWLTAPEGRRMIVVVGFCAVCWAIQASLIGTIGVSLFPLVFGLLYVNISQSRNLLANRVTLLGRGTNRTLDDQKQKENIECKTRQQLEHVVVVKRDIAKVQTSSVRHNVSPLEISGI